MESRKQNTGIIKRCPYFRVLHFTSNILQILLNNFYLISGHNTGVVINWGSPLYKPIFVIIMNIHDYVMQYSRTDDKAVQNKVR